MGKWLKMDGYEAKVYYSPNEECYVAQIVEFVGCAVDGSTPEIALARLHEAKNDWIRIMRENDHPVPPPRYGRLLTDNPKHSIPSQ